MITLKEWMELVQYRITEGSDYNLYGHTSYNLSSWNGKQNGYSMAITFDTLTQTVYCVEACDYANERAYRLVNPDYKNADDSKEAWDDVDWIDLEVDDDFIQKALAIRDGENYDNRVMIPLTMPDNEMFEIMKMAHERDMTLNDFIEETLRDYLDKNAHLVD
jgi:hypothetical protein